MPITHDLEHASEADALFIDQYKDKSRLSALLASYVRVFQGAEDALWDVYIKRLLDNATAAQLDTIGAIVGQPRIGTDDDAYRLFIRTRIRANRSRGRPEDIVQVAAIALSGIRFDYLEYYPASFVVEVLDPLPDFVTFIHDILTATKPAGVGWSLHYTPSTPGDSIFRFSSTDIEEDSDTGMSDTDEDGAGGLLISAL